MKMLTRITGTLLGIVLLATTATGAAAAQGVNQAPADPPALTAAEADGLVFMREEEKLARDVYAALYDRWGLAIFDNISRSEQAHLDAVGTLLERYRLADPVAGREEGEFANAELQALYDRLIAAGQESLVEALRAGAAIEEIDILDLQAELASTDHPYLVRVYQNLLRGSENHLRAFVSLLERQGSDYQPQVLAADRYAEILAAATSYGANRGPGGPAGARGRRGR